MPSRELPLTRRSALEACGGRRIRFSIRDAGEHTTAAPSETLYHASFGASGMAGADISR